MKIISENNETVQILNKQKEYLKHKFAVKNIAVFGSAIKNKLTKNSDVDILVEYRKDQKTFDNYMDLKEYLEQVFGRKVDLCLKNSIRKELRKKILTEAVYV